MIKLLSSDIDGTLLGKPDALLAFNATWKQHTVGQPYLCYNSGRLLDDILDLIESKNLIEPDFIISGVGTTIYDYRKKTRLKAFADALDEGWDRDQADQIIREMTDAQPQPKKYQTPYKTSWYLKDASEDLITQIDQALVDAGLNTQVVYSSNRDLDIIPRHANKGNALVWLMQYLDIKRAETLVAGDTGNDAAMFLVKGIQGIVVGNAQPELCEFTVGRNVYRAEGNCADGVLEGLEHFRVINDRVSIDPNHTAEVSDPTIHPDTRHLITEEELNYPSLSEKDFLYLRNAYVQAVAGLHKNITPMGFSACSLEDNKTEGTDVNYRSVWARDGAITLIGSLKLKDKTLRECQRKTLTTLLDHVTPNGQIPANVSIDTEEPDYSGVGGICSIDSGIWVIIAAFEYAHHHGDLEFLRDYWDVLQHVMNWLSAQDANNDGLVEVPEAGDWTDLFGRSYNPLYDEVIWYRANVCFGRMLEMQGRWQQAGDYMRWSSHIKRSILRKFWPSTQPGVNEGYSFADNQASLGDTHYLLAQTTPFSFDWRCDVYGNVLAFLMDVTNIEQAQKTFRFLWGVSVNEPFPVANLYPVVQAGDPDWKAYYTVNLLNLPHHYHNGGIWPFVGAMWVQFIQKLGFHDIALRELIRLAELNEAGVTGHWEFNEWAHGKTGKPMGKAYQAWSCAEFIRACHALKIV